MCVPGRSVPHARAKRILVWRFHVLRPNPVLLFPPPHGLGARGLERGTAKPFGLIGLRCTRIWTIVQPELCYNVPMNFKHTLAVAVPALLCGAVLGYLARLSSPAAAPAAPEAKAQRPAKKVKPQQDDDAVRRLRDRVKELERQLAEKGSPEQLEEQKVEEQPRQQAPRLGPGGWPRNAAEMRAHFEEMRRNNPEQYAAMTNGWAQRRARSLERAQGKLDILASVDINRLNPKQREVHEQYQNLIARNEEIQDLMDLRNEGVTDEQRDALWKEMHENRGKMRQLAQTEREVLLNQTARTFGVKGENAKELVDTVKAVYQATDTWGGWGRGPGGQGGRGRR